jgi:ribosomal protein L21E
VNVFKVGDKVRVKPRANYAGSSSGRVYAGQVGTITLIRGESDILNFNFVCLDIEGKWPNGIWMDEIEPIAEFEYEYV